MTKEEMDAYEARTGKRWCAWRARAKRSRRARRQRARQRALGFDAVLLEPGRAGHRTEEELVERTHAVAVEMPVIGFTCRRPAAGGAVV